MPISGLARKGAWLASAEELSKDTPSSIINSSCSSISKTSAQSSSLRISRWSPIERERRGARLCPPTVHNEQSSCRDTVSLWAWWRLPEACGLARLLCDNTGQVALPMTSNPRSVQNGQHSSPNVLEFWVREVLRRGQCSHGPSGSTTENQASRVYRNCRLPLIASVAGCRAFVTECNELCQSVNG